MAESFITKLLRGAGAGLQTFGRVRGQQLQQQAIGEREQQRIELQQEQQRMQQGELIRELQGEQEAELQKEEDDALERIVFRDPQGAVDRGVTSIGEVRQRFPDLYDQFFNPAVVAERNRQKVEDDRATAEELRTQAKHDSDIKDAEAKRKELAAKLAQSEFDVSPEGRAQKERKRIAEKGEAEFKRKRGAKDPETEKFPSIPESFAAADSVMTEETKRAIAKGLLPKIQKELNISSPRNRKFSLPSDRPVLEREGFNPNKPPSAENLPPDTVPEDFAPAVASKEDVAKRDPDADALQLIKETGLSRNQVNWQTIIDSLGENYAKLVYDKFVELEEKGIY